jgi:hypothetical protein
MAAEVIEAVPVAARPPMRWGAIFGGVFAALGIWLLLYAFGLAVGLTSIDPHHPSSLKGSGIFAGVWGVIVTPIVALFIGGFVAGHGSGVLARGEGALHALVMWGLATVAGAWLAFMLVSMLVSGAAAVGKTAVQAGGAAVGAAGAGMAPIARGFGVDANDVLGPVNQRLRAEGKPEITAAQLQAATKDVVRQGNLDRDTLVQSVTQNTALTRADAEDIADRVEAQWQGARQRLGSGLQQVETGALRAVQGSSALFWGAFVSIALGLIAAIVGGAVGTGGYGGRLRRERVARRVAPPREVPVT